MQTFVRSNQLGLFFFKFVMNSWFGDRMMYTGDVITRPISCGHSVTTCDVCGLPPFSVFVFGYVRDPEFPKQSLFLFVCCSDRGRL